MKNDDRPNGSTSSFTWTRLTAKAKTQIDELRIEESRFFKRVAESNAIPLRILRLFRDDLNKHFTALLKARGRVEAGARRRARQTEKLAKKQAKLADRKRAKPPSAE